MSNIESKIANHRIKENKLVTLPKRPIVRKIDNISKIGFDSDDSNSNSY